jgi:hypothetical protein
VNPALDEFKGLAAEMRAESERVAAEHGQHLSTSLASDRAVSASSLS